MSRISVALAAYNGKEYIAEQLKSLLAQTRVPDEIVITDDSADNSTFEAIKPFLECKQLVYIKNAEPLGVTKNFEKAITLCTGDYIFLCDQDDVWLPEKIHKMADILDSKQDIDGVFCNSQLVNSKLEDLNKDLWALRKFTAKMQRELATGNALKIFCKRVTLSSHNVAFRRSVLQTALPFPELAPFFPDTWLALLTAAGGKWHAVNEILTLYRIHSSNESTPQGQEFSAARRARKSQAALRNALLAEEVISRRQKKLSAGDLALLQDFALHHRTRSELSGCIFCRLAAILKELFSMRYSKYSNGIKTAIADLLLSPGK